MNLKPEVIEERKKGTIDKLSIREIEFAG